MSKTEFCKCEPKYRQTKIQLMDARWGYKIGDYLEGSIAALGPTNMLFLPKYKFLHFLFAFAYLYLNLIWVFVYFPVFFMLGEWVSILEERVSVLKGRMRQRLGGRGGVVASVRSQVCSCHVRKPRKIFKTWSFYVTYIFLAKSKTFYANNLGSVGELWAQFGAKWGFPCGWEGLVYWVYCLLCGLVFCIWHSWTELVLWGIKEAVPRNMVWIFCNF